jgi:glutamine synthetase
VYGKFNELRLTGKHETAPISVFRYGVADRGASIRIPSQTFKVIYSTAFCLLINSLGSLSKQDGKGYYEDRRPASNMDPYTVCARVAKTTLLDKD